MSWLALILKRFADHGLAETSKLLSGSIAAQLIYAAAFAIVARLYPKDTFALFAASLGALAVLTDVLEFGASGWLLREYAAARITSSDVRTFIRRRTLVSIAITVPIALTCGVLSSNLYLSLSSAAYLVGYLVNTANHSRLRAENRFGRSAIHLICERLAILVMFLAPASYLSTRFRGEQVAWLVFSSSAILILSTSFMPRIRADGRGTPLTLRHVYVSSRHLGFLGLSSDLQQLDTALSAVVLPIRAVADVAVASKLTGPLGLASSAISQVIYRRDSANPTNYPRRRDPLFLVSAVIFAALVLLTPALPFLVTLVYGAQYWSARWTVVAYAAGVAIAVLNQPLASTLNAARLDRHVAIVVTISIAIGLATSVVLASFIHAVAMGIGFLFTQALVAALLITVYRRHRRGHIEPSNEVRTSNTPVS